MASVDGLVEEEFAAAGRNDALTDAVGIRVCRNHPEFIERLAAAESPAAVLGIVEELRAVVREAVDRHIEIEDLRAGVAERVRAGVAALFGLPPGAAAAALDGTVTSTPMVIEG